MLGPARVAPKAHREICQVAAVCHDCVQVTSQVDR